jgi:DNA repair protein SbcD/Mre11
MRIIHTGDWHMNHRLGRKDLTEDIKSAIEQVAVHVKEKQADVLLIAGDLFQGRESRDQLRASLRFLKQTFEPFLHEGGTIIAISGNHDNENFFLTLQDAFDMVSPVEEKDGIHAPGRLYIAPKPDILKLRGTNGQIVQFVLMPYPIPTAYLPVGENLSNNPNDRVQVMTDTYRNTLNEKIQIVDESHPAVLVCHATVNGTALTDLFRPNSREVMLEVGDLPDHFAYGAFGHIHCPGPVSKELERFRYCGSLLPLDAGEAGQAKSVTFIEIGQEGLIDDPKQLPITGRHLRKVEIDAADVDCLDPKYSRCETNCQDDDCHKTALVRYTLCYKSADYPDPYPLHRKIQAFFPDWYGNDINRTDPTDGGKGPTTGVPVNPGDICKTVLDYLKDRAAYAGTDTDKQQVIALAEALLNSDVLMKAVHDSEGTLGQKKPNKAQQTQRDNLIKVLMDVKIKEVGA